MENNCKAYPYRYIARIIVEAESVIAVGTGERNVFTDSPIARDVNGLPYIPATSIAGIVRHALDVQDGEPSIFGFHDSKGGKGSQVIFTDALMVGVDGKTVDGLVAIDWKNDVYAAYRQLPIREHVCIGGNGTAIKGGKFDNEVVYKGTRFVFEIEIYSEENLENEFSEILTTLYDDSLRIGGGSRKGYGKLSVVNSWIALLDLSIEQDLNDYITKSSNLSIPWTRFSLMASPKKVAANDWTKYLVHLSPSDFFLFGSRMGDDEADNTPMAERIVTWDGMKPTITREQVLIPASAVKGALAHRTAYHYNRLNHLFVENADNHDSLLETKATIGSNNPAVAAIFGKMESGKTTCGNLLITDVIEGDVRTKVFFHNRIDVFTGGIIKGALFQEKSIWAGDKTYTLEILVSNSALEDSCCKEAFEHSIQDLCDGLLPLGGNVNRGHGIFVGQWTKNR